MHSIARLLHFANSIAFVKQGLSPFETCFLLLGRSFLLRLPGSFVPSANFEMSPCLKPFFLNLMVAARLGFAFRSLGAFMYSSNAVS